MLGTSGKAISVLVTGAIGWATAVVASAPQSITASEWVALATVGASAVTCWIISNAPASASVKVSE
jgi:hypothetical protein